MIKNSNLSERKVDSIVKTSEQKIGGMSLISKSRVKLWKALLFSFFFAGFAGSVGLMYGADLGMKTNAQVQKREDLKSEKLINTTRLMEVKGLSYTKQGNGWDKLIDGDGGDFMIARWAGKPSVDISVPNKQTQLFKGMYIENDFKNIKYKKCALMDYTLMISKDGVNYSKFLDGSVEMGNDLHYINFNNGNDVEANSFRLQFNSNWGDENWLCIKEINLVQ